MTGAIIMFILHRIYVLIRYDVNNDQNVPLLYIAKEMIRKLDDVEKTNVQDIVLYINQSNLTKEIKNFF